MSIAILTGLGFALGTALFFVGLDLSRSRAVSAAPFQTGYNAAPVAPPMSLRDRIDSGPQPVGCRRIGIIQSGQNFNQPLRSKSDQLLPRLGRYLVSVALAADRFDAR